MLVLNNNKTKKRQKLEVMDALKAEIARKRAQTASLLAPNRKYVRRADLDAINSRNEESSEKANDDNNEENTEEKRSKDESFEDDEDDAVLRLPRAEVVRRLRECGQPSLKFGETERDAARRLRQVQLDRPDAIPGIRNDFKEAMDKVDEAYLEELLKSQGTELESGSKKRSKLDVALPDTDLTYDSLLSLVNDTRQGDTRVDDKVISQFVKVILRLWGEDLNARDEDVKMSVRGKIDSGIYTQTRTYLKPLLKMIRKQMLTEDIRDSLLKMVRYALQRDYIMCNEAYMEMAIGNAPWPIGVTNAGIHARPARENIFSKQIAHVLNDETQRKYIQGFKRLLTKAQHFFPTDPSRSIDYVKREGQEEKEQQ